MSSTVKRHRTPSDTSISSASTTNASHYPSKSSRLVADTQLGSSTTSHPLLCTLPPTCTHRPTPLANSKDLETHYATYHAHVCEQARCMAVFPDAWLLELHQTECHDPIAAVRKDKGEKIFACHLSNCPRLFSTPKTRRLHLIQAHGYPKEYFFAVTNKGVGGLLKKWGEGASMIRGQWKPRETTQEREDDDKNEDDEEDLDHADDIMDAEQQSPTPTPTGYPTNQPDTNNTSRESTTKSIDTDGLVNAMISLSLVPSSIQFGRGGKKGGFTHATTPEQHTTVSEGRGSGRGVRGNVRGRGRGRANPPATTGAKMNVDTSSSDVQNMGSGGRHIGHRDHGPPVRGMYGGRSKV